MLKYTIFFMFIDVTFQSTYRGCVYNDFTLASLIVAINVCCNKSQQKYFLKKYILIMYYILCKYVRVKKGVFRHVSDACQLRSRGLFTQTWTLNQRNVQLLTPFNFKVLVIELLGELDIAHYPVSVLIFMASATSNFRYYLCYNIYVYNVRSP